MLYLCGWMWSNAVPVSTNISGLGKSKAHLGFRNHLPASGTSCPYTYNHLPVK
jgi:hypothetical protein